MNISLLSPWFLLAGLAGIIPILLHLLQRRREVILPFPMVRFILLARKKSSRRLKLRRLFLLLLRVAALLLVAFVLSRPVLQSPASDLAGGENVFTVVIADNSLSMAAHEGGLSRFALLRELSKGLVSRGGSGGRFAIIPVSRSGETPEVPVWTGPEEFLEALSRTEVLPHRGDFTGAFEEAYLLLREAASAQRRIVVFTDLGRGSWADFSHLAVRESDPSVPVRIYSVAGGGAAGAGILGVEASGESMIAGGTVQVEGRLVNWGPAGPLSVELRVDGRPAGRRIVEIAAGGEGKVGFRVEELGEGDHRLELQLEEDGYREDDTRLLGLTLARHPEVLLVDGDPRSSLVESETFFIREALRSERLSLEDPISVSVVSADGLEHAVLDDYDVVVLANVPAPADGRELTAFVSGGGSLIVFWGDNCLAGEYASSLPGLLPVRLGENLPVTGGDPFRLGQIDFGHEVLSVFRPPAGGSFSTAAFYRRAEVEEVLPAGAALARFTDGGPWLVLGKAGSGEVMLFTSTADLEWNDLPVKPVFVPLVRRAILGLSGNLFFGGGEDLAAGGEKIFQGSEKLAFTTMAVTSPDGVRRRVDFRPEADKVVARFRETSRPGYYSYSREGEKGIFAVNVPPEESDLRPIDEGEIKSRFQQVPLDLFSADRETAEFFQAGPRSLARPILVALFLLLLLEMFVAGPRFNPFRPLLDRVVHERPQRGAS